MVGPLAAYAAAQETAPRLQVPADEHPIRPETAFDHKRICFLQRGRGVLMLRRPQRHRPRLTRRRQKSCRFSLLIVRRGFRLCRLPLDPGQLRLQ